EPLYGIWPLILLALVLALGWFFGRPLFRAAEQGFWSLNSLAVQPGYALCREGLRHLTERMMPRAGAKWRARVRSATAAAAGISLSGVALGVVSLPCPASRWIGEVADPAAPHRLLAPALANSVVLLAAYLALTAFVWGIADATMDQPHDLQAWDPPSPLDGTTWRVAHLSDLHVVGERYGFRIESGRSGPCGNERIWRVFARLDAIHAERPIDLILITGDLTDSGRSAEWVEFLAALARFPRLAAKTLILPGNHDVNVVDRTNPARLDLPTSPGKCLRQMRALSAIAAVQGDRIRVVDSKTGQLGHTLSDALAPYRDAITAFADAGTFRL